MCVSDVQEGRLSRSEQLIVGYFYSAPLLDVAFTSELSHRLFESITGLCAGRGADYSYFHSRSHYYMPIKVRIADPSRVTLHHHIIKLESGAKPNVARPTCTNVNVHFLPTDLLCYCHLANDH